MSERHRLANGANDARAHDLVGGLRCLACTVRSKVTNRSTHLLEYRPRVFEIGGVTAAHDGERAVLGTFDTAAYRTIEKAGAA